MLVSDQSGSYYLVVDAAKYTLKLWQLVSAPQSNTLTFDFNQNAVSITVVADMGMFKCHSYDVRLAMGSSRYEITLAINTVHSLDEYICITYVHLLAVDDLKRLVHAMGGHVASNAAYIVCLECVLDLAGVSDGVKQSMLELGRKRVSKRRKKAADEQAEAPFVQCPCRTLDLGTSPPPNTMFEGSWCALGLADDPRKHICNSTLPPPLPPPIRLFPLQEVIG
jgi:hypothetical protein